MRKRVTRDRFSVHAIAGNHTIILGMDAAKKATKGLLGFAIHREDHTENEAYWLRGFKAFEVNQSGMHPGKLVSTRQNPVQSFLWGDYTVKPDHTYTYRVVPLYGEPRALVEGPGVEVTVSSEPVDDGAHAVFFNRGGACCQAYTRKFCKRRHRKPSEVPNRAAYKWLSRGLEEGLLDFIAQADGPDYGLRAAVYEFSYLPVLKAFKKAARLGADVRIVYDARTGKDKPVTDSDKAIKKVGIRRLMTRRTKNRSYISHNKFIVLLEEGEPVEVWTGSTNITEGGIFGQSNVGHIVRDPGIARAYHAYWQELSADPTVGGKSGLRVYNDQATPVPEDRPRKGLTPVFSPRGSLAALEWYAGLMDKARTGVCFTAAFGVNPALAEVLGEEKGYLRYVLLEKPGKNIKMITQDKDVRVAIGTELGATGTDRILDEWLTGLNEHVRYVHTKYMLIDPLSDDPITISGSANFSSASTKNNDENMLIDRGDTRLADCYLCEFMRLFNHYYYRDVFKRMSADPESRERASTHLKPDDSWAAPYYERDSAKWKTRLHFRGRKVKGHGITFFDIDETIFHTFAKVWVMKGGKVVKKLDNRAYNTYELGPGESFDYREFGDARLFARTSKIMRGTLAKMIIMTKNARRTGSTIALLTARGTFPDMETFKNTFSRYGVPIENIEINFAGDLSVEGVRVPEAKKRIVKKYLATGIYRRARLLDDDMANLKAFLSIAKSFPEVRFQAIHIDRSGKAHTVK